MKSLFIRSFKRIDKRFIYVALFDFLFYLGVAFSFWIFAKLLVWSLGSFFMVSGAVLSAGSIAGFDQVAASAGDLGLLLRQFQGKLALSFAVLWLLLVIVFTFFKGLAWGFVSGQKLGRRYFAQFFRLNLLWLGCLALLCLFLFGVLKPGAAGLVLLLLSIIAVYLTSVLYAVFNPGAGIKDLFRMLWRAGIERFYLFAVPWVIAVSLLLAFVFLVIALLAVFYQNAALFALFAVLVLWQAWFKYYLYLAAGGIK